MAAHGFVFTVAPGPFAVADLSFLNVQRTKKTWWVGGGQGGGFAMAAVKGDTGSNVVVARVHQSHFPRFDYQEES